MNPKDILTILIKLTKASIIFPDANFWQADKIKHYKYCYTHTISAKKGFTLFWGICVGLTVSAFKELGNDLILKKGTPSIEDCRANYWGCQDAWNGKESKF